MSINLLISDLPRTGLRQPQTRAWQVIQPQTPNAARYVARL
jgi:hypothetical protein